MNETSSSDISGTKVKNCLIVTVGEGLSDNAFEDAQQIVLNGIHQDGCLAVVFELSRLKFMDTFEFQRLKSIAEMALVLGAKTLFCGLNTGIIFHLISNNVNTEGLRATLDLDEALNLALIEIQSESEKKVN